MFSKDAEGHEITRQATCLCGREFTQRLLGSRFMELVERAGDGPVRALMRDIPELFVPVNCPPCEHRQLQPGPVMTSFGMPRNHLTNRERFAENMARLFGAFNRPSDEPTVRAYWLALEWVLSDDRFEEAVIGVIRSERRWPTAATLAQWRPAA